MDPRFRGGDIFYSIGPRFLNKGIYKHYKGKFYEVLGIVHHSETLEELVLYKALYQTKFGRKSLWVRPKKMFCEKVTLNKKRIPRFLKIKNPSS